MSLQASGSSVFERTSLSRRTLEALTAGVTTTDGETDERETITVEAPATGETVGHVPSCTADDVERAVRDARDAQEDWERLPPTDRGAIVSRFGDLLLDHRDELLDVVQLETGKARSDAVEELLGLPTICAYYAATGPSLVADESRSSVLPGVASARVTPKPVGVVGIISPWNYPLILALADAIPALVAGTAVVCKPDPQTSFIALRLRELLIEAGMPADVLQIVTGGGETGEPLVDCVDYVTFTGSAATGRIVAAQAGRNLIDCSMELGGKNPMVVMADADIERTVRGAIQACFNNAGQLCLAAERIYVHESRYEEFLGAFVDATESLELGTSFDYGPDVGSLIGETQLETVKSHVDGAVADGATIRTGGEPRPDVGPYCFEPTILTDLDPDATTACEETFGPVVSVWPVSDISSAIEHANDSPYGLNASVWTANRERGEQVAREIDCGTVCVNDGYAVCWAAIDAPMGGMGDSGIGPRNGPEGLTRYLEPKTIATSRIGPIDKPPGIPWGVYVRLMTVLARTQRYIPAWLR